MSLGAEILNLLLAVLSQLSVTQLPLNVNQIPIEVLLTVTGMPLECLYKTPLDLTLIG